MPRDGTATRQRILDATQRLVIAQGFAATSVDEVIAAAGTTKGGLFHHFASKQDLARALVERYAAEDAAVLDELIRRSERLSHDPLQQLLIFVGLLTEETEQQMRTSPGCLFASFLYERQLVDDATRDLIAESLRHTRERLRLKLAEIASRYPPRAPVDLDALADQVTILIEGTYVLVRALGERNLVGGQLDQFRTYLELLFSPISPAGVTAHGPVASTPASRERQSTTS
jgi:TetR/AcrR family transcriptional regulator, transcriptional repressor for nem operon